MFTLETIPQRTQFLSSSNPSPSIGDKPDTWLLLCGECTHPTLCSPFLLPETCLSPNFSHMSLASLLASLGLSSPLHKMEASLGNTDQGMF